LTVRFVELGAPAEPLRIEYAWIAPQRRERPLLVFLHEGLGSLAMWRDWPAQVCAAGDFRGLVYSRPGYGQSTPRPAHERWRPDFMHVHALDVLPRLLAALASESDTARPWLVGHSDGGSIALILAARRPGAVAGVVAIAPHIFVEDVSIASIEKAREAYRTTDLPRRLVRYHADPDSAFYGWNDVWLAPQFRDWSIEAMLSRLHCPVLAIQGVDDEYGTLAQIEGIRERAPQAELVVLDGCGHSPHRDRADAMTQAIVGFVARHEPLTQR